MFLEILQRDRQTEVKQIQKETQSQEPRAKRQVKEQTDRQTDGTNACLQLPNADDELQQKRLKEIFT